MTSQRPQFDVIHPPVPDLSWDKPLACPSPSDPPCEANELAVASDPDVDRVSDKPVLEARKQAVTDEPKSYPTKEPTVPDATTRKQQPYSEPNDVAHEPAVPAGCPVCGSLSIELFLRRGSVPVHQNLLLRDAETAGNIRRGQLAMHVCDDCGFVFNAAFDDRLMSYNQDYENTQVHSPAFNAYVDGLVETTLNESGVHGGTIVEVGCGKGDFIKRLLARDTQAKGHGFDPSYLGPEIVCDGRLKFEKRFYDASCADLKSDIIVCRHVIEHIPQPLDIVRSVRSAVASSPDAHVFFETPCVDWILKHRVTWDFFYEHCSLFTSASLTTLFEKSGFAVRSVSHVFGGQYLWLHAQPSEGAGRLGQARGLQSEKASSTTFKMNPGDTPKMAREFQTIEAKRNRNWIDFVHMQSKLGKLVLWGAGAKAVTFANLVDPNRQWIEAVVDVNPSKQGKYLAGSRHPIVAPESLLGIAPTSILVLNPNYRVEIEQRLASVGIHAEIVDMMNDGTH